MRTSLARPLVVQSSFRKLYNGKNKTFFFVNPEFYLLRGGAQNSIGSVPDTAFRSGNFSGLVDANGNQIPIYDPNTTVPNGSGRLYAIAIPREHHSR